ncbi:MAG TPA: ABC transporter substrate-binding protein, partial [Xanthobacteraceae bacterium]|jgi:putative ABC transport system substrate-binding protein
MRFDQLKRRELIALLGGGALSWPLGAGGQTSPPIVGFMMAGSRAALRDAVAAFEAGLKEMGFIERQNLALEYRFADGQFEQFPALASDLIHRQVSVIAVSSPQGALAAMRATTAIPIVFSIGADPVEVGLVPRLSRPGGNVTGVYQFTAGLEAKRLGLLHEMVPKADIVGVLVNPNYAAAESQLHDVQDAAAHLGLRPAIARANMDSELDAAFATVISQRAGAILVCASPFFNSRREQLIALAGSHALPAIFEWRDFAVAGGLMSYGTSLNEAYRQAGAYAGRILKGEKAADLPVVQSTKFELVINLRAAKALHIEVPPTLSARADEIIE